MDDWTLGLSIYAAAVATFAAGWRIVEFAWSGRRLVVDADFDQMFVYVDIPGPSGERADPIEYAAFEVTFRSVGRQAVTIDACRIEFRESAAPAIDLAPLPEPDDEPRWPMRLDPGEGESVSQWRNPDSLPPSGGEFRAVAELGSGKTVASPWRTLTRRRPTPPSP